MKKAKKTLKTKAEGITLIALVVTIIVLLILAGISIAMLTGENGILNRAKEASEKTEIATEKEQRQLAMYEASMNISGMTFQDVEIPAGFAPTRIAGESTVDEGLVITDSEGNEFVWIPVEEAFTGEDEKLSETVEWEKQEYEEMKASVNKYKGFYIGRYEAGSTTERKGFKEEGNETTKMVVKRDQYPYNWVAWGSYNEDTGDYSNDVITALGENNGKGAVYLCEQLYDGKSVGVGSTLCYKIQWDAMINFFKSQNQINEDGTVDWANLKSSRFLIERSEPKYLAVTYNEKTRDMDHWKSAKGTTGSGLGSRLLTTGASDSTECLNIYDVCGNCAEFLMDIGTAEKTRKTVGLNADCNMEHNALEIVWNLKETDWGSMQGFRPALYIM